MIPARFRLSQLATFGLILSQALGLCLGTNTVFAQAANGTKPSLPTPINAQSLTGLEMPPQMLALPNTALPNSAAPSNVIGNNSSAIGQTTDLIRLYQEAAFSDPVLNAARFNYQASKELYWQGLSLLLPQANATPAGTRYYQHTAGNAPAGAVTGSRVYDQKSYTVTLTQPVFNIAALEAFKQGDIKLMKTKGKLRLRRSKELLDLEVRVVDVKLMKTERKLRLRKSKGLLEENYD